MFIPTPVEFGRTDDDCAAVTWKRGRKVLVLHLNCYGSAPHTTCGLMNPPGGSVSGLKFNAGWEWFCDDANQELPKVDLVPIQALIHALEADDGTRIKASETGLFP